MLHGLTDEFLAAVAASQQWKLQVLVKNALGTTLADITDDVVGGAVQVDETREIRRTCSLTMNATKALIPSKSGDLLHPASANELWISRGVEYPDGTSELAPLGVFRISKPVTNDTNQAITFTISGNDRASVVARQSWQTAYQIAAGANIAAVVQNALLFLIGNIYPNMEFDGFDFTQSFLFPITTWGTSPGQLSDPMSDLQSFAAAAGFEVFFDVLGQPVFRSIVNPTNSLVIDGVHFVEGENCTMTQVGRTIDETVGYNGVILTCNGPGGAGPFKVTVWDIDTASPTYYRGPWGEVPYPMTTTTIPAGNDDFVTAQSKGTVMAEQQLQLILGALDTTNISTVPNPALREGDCVKVRRDRINIDSTYVLSSMTIPLDPKTLQTINFRPQVTT